MKFTHIRNATALFEYAGVTFLSDPFLADKGAYPGFPGTLNADKGRNPTASLPMTVSEIVKQTEAVLVSHTHIDNWDTVAAENLPKDIKIFAQLGSNAPFTTLQPKDTPSENEAMLVSQGFVNIQVITETVSYKGISITPISGQHGDAEVYADPIKAAFLGDAAGFVLQAPSEPTLYIIGNTIWTKEVAQALEKYQPEVVIVSAGCAQVIAEDGHPHPVIMGAEDFVRVHKFVPKAFMIANTLEAVVHGTLSRKDLRSFLSEKNLLQYVAIPDDGETIICEAN